ncbi:MAG TPA: hypothetical protein VFR23_18480 [Jiangellaceae bacterium]|nr:hypothetical protein [Jiangellaceae bacterium]
MSRAGRLVATVAVLALIGAGAAALLVWWTGGQLTPLAREECVAEVGENRVSLHPEQAIHAATIAAVAEQRTLPARAITIALATAFQESDLYNLDYGDRDSLGLFQQRPSQGWGTPDQIQDPVYAARAFYEELVKISDYRELEITDAAQRVQRSAFPEAYAQHESKARALASALSGNSPAGLTCTFRPASYSAEELGDDGLTPRARTVLEETESAHGPLTVGGFDPDGIDSGHIAGSAHYDGRAIDIFFRPHNAPASKRSGWVVAHWLVVNADRLGIATVIYDDQIWTARRSAEGWRPYTHPSGNTTDPTLRHLDHVHLDVVRGG